MQDTFQVTQVFVPQVVVASDIAMAQERTLAEESAISNIGLFMVPATVIPAGTLNYPRIRQKTKQVMANSCVSQWKMLSVCHKR